MENVDLMKQKTETIVFFYNCVTEVRKQEQFMTLEEGFYTCFFQASDIHRTSYWNGCLILIE